MICFSIMGVIIESSFFIGCLSKSLSEGGSVASARAPKESMIKFIHIIWTAEKRGWFKTKTEISVVITATMFTVT